MLTRDALLQELALWRGTPYVSEGGALSRETGTDCSGLVVASLAELDQPFAKGIRTAEQIRQACDPLTDMSQAQAGDLLFFENTYDDEVDRRGPDGRLATHVGFYMSGGPQDWWMFDCNETQGAGYSRVNAYWTAHLLDIRRLPQMLAPAPAPANVDLDAVRAFVANALAPDGELVPALNKVQTALTERKYGPASKSLDSIVKRMLALWDEWNS